MYASFDREFVEYKFVGMVELEIGKFDELDLALHHYPIFFHTRTHAATQQLSTFHPVIWYIIMLQRERIG